ncbi:MAG: SMP-30/gluconolactonase/LRE family protein [Deltaproteobacteria bacterium]|nr:SMP-30/gluconolactonase/LRE family protein [Deltaproteobacteria bacterium]
MFRKKLQPVLLVFGLVTSLLFLAACGAGGDTPANSSGEPKWYISFTGGSNSSSINNIMIYSQDGTAKGKALNESGLPAGVTLKELRGFTFGPDANLYVVNAYKDYSQVLQFKGLLNANGQYDFSKVFVQHSSSLNPGLDHPLSAVFSSDGNLYLSSQDTDVISRYYGPKSTIFEPAQPMKLPSALVGVGNFYPGTFVPSSTQMQNGLKAVQDAAFGPDGNLYVADRDDNSVKKYDGQTAAYLGKIVSDKLIQPIHLLFSPAGDYLYIGSSGRDAVPRYNLKTGQVEDFITPKSGGLSSPSGLAFGPDKYLYVASRLTNQILRYDAATGKPDQKPFIDGLKDNPEFLVLVNN